MNGTGYETKFYIPVEGTDEVVVVPLSQLPEDPEELLNILRGEVAPLTLWLDFAKAYLSQGKEDQFVKLLEVGKAIQFVDQLSTFDTGCFCRKTPALVCDATLFASRKASPVGALCPVVTPGLASTLSVHPGLPNLRRRAHQRKWRSTTSQPSMSEYSCCVPWLRIPLPWAATPRTAAPG
jgi:hypothetical protein